MIAGYGFSSIEDIYVQQMHQACQRLPGKTVRFVSFSGGDGAVEIRLAEALLKLGAQRFVLECVGLNPSFAGPAARLAEEQGMGERVKFHQQALQDWEPAHTYEVVLASHCLHQLSALQPVIEKINRCLSPNGRLVVHDVVGRNGYLRWPETLAPVVAFWETLPDQYKFDSSLQEQAVAYEDQAPSGGSSVASMSAQELLPILVSNFQFELFLWWGGAVDVFIDRRFGHNFDIHSSHDQKFIHAVQHLDEQRTISGEQKPTQLIAVVGKEQVANKRYWRGITPESCMRTPDWQPPVGNIAVPNVYRSPTQATGRSERNSGRAYNAFIFTHIPKCAGTSFREYIFNAGVQNGIGLEQIYVPGFGNVGFDKNISQLTKPELGTFRMAGKKILADHSLFEDNMAYQLGMDRPFHYTILREPIDRFISHYNYFYRHLNYWNLKGVHLNDLKQETLVQLLERMANLQLIYCTNPAYFNWKNASLIWKLCHYGQRCLRFVSMGMLFKPVPIGLQVNNANLAQGIENLKTNYGTFGIIEQMEASLACLQDASPDWLDLSAVDFPVRNEGHKFVDDVPINGRVMDLIKQYHYYDLKFYESAWTIFEAIKK